MQNIAIFASGNGSNAQTIAEFFHHHPGIKVSLILTNNPEAYVIQRASHLAIPSYIFNRETFYHTSRIRDLLNENGITLIVLAGFLWMVPPGLVDAFPDRIVNIHPALLPRFGGKGMYGRHVHEAVLLSGSKESGITIHLVNNRYDEGRILFQARCPVLPGDTPETLAERIHQLEHRHYPEVIEQLMMAPEP
jgi:phosphoribosylglycinamide formyltransferase-1